ncbi:hypothetical protein [Streptococcus dysgalactiae]|uniref:Uncharacterized protein n=2 Tax=Streptococcus dysgalactiae TaxID=1334 RepID=A0A9X7SAX1_STRDY|nr:hypothetical protein [Streptococcus dysgalactiae]MEC4578034.1 hypothetical protein [Streptococcus dysgalactiae]QGH01416.1 hypothetical protein EA457_02060 [Streptococcus dysgalactiae subsp. dysgalactiae]QGH05108.1 hypothetical protein EA458_12040 [Streptococcus dysgalactiae subsp. dysgalactiae]WAI93195.1 hypothetical protein MP619_00815 [Streptococcus dysgalactiae]WCE86295.1 hypothetical protein PMN45_01550 [Streptococcus dysgalactiae]
MSQPKEIDLRILKRAMVETITNYTPSVESFDISSNDVIESNKELAQFIVSELTPQLQSALEKALDPDIDFDTFMRLNNIKMAISKD